MDHSEIELETLTKLVTSPAHGALPPSLVLISAGRRGT